MGKQWHNRKPKHGDNAYYKMKFVELLKKKWTLKEIAKEYNLTKEDVIKIVFGA